MNLLRYFGTQENTFTYSNTGIPQWLSCRYLSLSEEGFQKNVFVFRAINLIAKGIASIPLYAINPDGNKDEQISDLINNPNDSISKAAFIEAIVSYLLISGNAFIRFDGKNQLQSLRPDRVQIVPNKEHTAVEYYVYHIDNTKYSLGKNEILHLKFFNPLNDWYGISPLQIVSQSIDQYNEMAKHNLSILQNGGRPSGCLILKNGEELSEEQLQQLRTNICKAYSGPNHAGKILLLQGGIEWKEMGLSPKDLDFEAGRKLSIIEISQAFGIPPVLLGIECNSSFNSYKEARLNFWEDTVLPLANLIKNEFSKWLSICFQRKIELVFDLESIHALTERREALWHKIANADFLSIDEKREILGFAKKQKKGNSK